VKQCVECKAEVDDRAYVCPKCGGKNLIGSYTVEDALGVLDSMKSQTKAKDHVDRAAQLYLEVAAVHGIDYRNTARRMDHRKTGTAAGREHGAPSGWLRRRRLHDLRRPHRNPEPR
jgi:RNA polymerase subunit RPABC4/transcription elongation factor Spt4